MMMRRLGLTLAACTAFTSAAHAEAPTFHSTSRFVVSDPSLPVTVLKKGVSQSGVVEGPGVCRFAMDLRKGDFAAVRLDQTGGDLILNVFGPDGQLLDIVDQNNVNETETGLIVAPKDGRYLVQVAQYDWRAGNIAFAITLSRKEPEAKSPVARANQLMESWYDKNHPGAALIILKDGKVAYRKMIGLANVETAVPISGQTRFELASVSKQFTGFAIAMLIDRGILSRKDDVRRWLPELPASEPTTTIGHLLDHMSGFRDWDAGLGLAGLPAEHGMTVSNILDFAARQRSRNFPPGSAQSYSNTGYALLGEIISRATGMPADRWMAENMFGPLGMRQSGLNLDPGAVIRDKAASYEGRTPATRLSSGSNGAAGGSTSVYATADDLVRWVGNLQSGQVGGPGVMALLAKPETLPDSSSTNYTFGLWHQPHRGLASIGHLGLAAGYRTRVTRFPDQKAAIIFLSNDGDDAGYARSERIEELFLPVSPRPPVEAQIDSAPDPTPPLPELHPADYVGTYWSDEVATGYVITSENGQLKASHPINGKVPLTRTGTDAFTSGRWYMPELSFKRDASGKITEFSTGTEAAGDIRFRKLP